MIHSKYLISIIIPLYNESENFEMLTSRIDSLIKEMNIEIEVVMIDDGSKDDTPLKMQAHAMNNKNYNCVFLSKNFGHQIAVTAGIHEARATDALFIIDGDLQDPPELLKNFYELYKNGYDVVYAVRKKRKENIIKRIAYNSFYRILNKISTIKIPIDSGDFSLISRRVADIMKQMPEESRFLRGMRYWIGFNQYGYEYERSERAAGTPKYTFKKLWQLAKNGIFNFSEAPVKFMKRTGYIAITLSVVYLIYILIKKLLYNSVPQGFTTLIFAFILFSGFQFIFMGLLGEYILRIFFQVKQRPLFIIKNQMIEGEYKTIIYGEKEPK